MMCILAMIGMSCGTIPAKAIADTSDYAWHSLPARVTETVQEVRKDLTNRILTRAVELHESRADLGAYGCSK